MIARKLLAFGFIQFVFFQDDIGPWTLLVMFFRHIHIEICNVGDTKINF